LGLTVNNGRFCFFAVSPPTDIFNVRAHIAI
jgi:hypothetical protein